MANKKAARKFVLQSRKKAAANSSVRNRIRTLAKKLRDVVKTGVGDMSEAANAYISALDKAAKRNIVHKNSVNRKKSMCAKLVVTG